MHYRELAKRIEAIAPGEGFTVNRHELERIAPPVPLVGPHGPMWSPAERIMEAIVGAAYEFRFWEDHASGRITFERLRNPLAGGLRSYVSPDRVALFARTPDGLYQPKPDHKIRPLEAHEVIRSDDHMFGSFAELPVSVYDRMPEEERRRFLARVGDMPTEWRPVPARYVGRRADAFGLISHTAFGRLV